jgi:hypothetical protein
MAARNKREMIERGMTHYREWYQQVLRLNKLRENHKRMMGALGMLQRVGRGHIVRQRLREQRKRVTLL